MASCGRNGHSSIHFVRDTHCTQTSFESPLSSPMTKQSQEVSGFTRKASRSCEAHWLISDLSETACQDHLRKPPMSSYLDADARPAARSAMIFGGLILCSVLMELTAVRQPRKVYPLVSLQGGVSPDRPCKSLLSTMVPPSTHPAEEVSAEGFTEASNGVFGPRKRLQKVYRIAAVGETDVVFRGCGAVFHCRHHARRKLLFRNGNNFPPLRPWLSEQGRPA
jgi:hypothetical protein